MESGGSEVLAELFAWRRRYWQNLSLKENNRNRHYGRV
jgi:hypothetical protein